MIDAAAVLPAVCRVERRNAGVLEEGREVRARPQRADLEIAPRPCLRVAVDDLIGAHPFPDRPVRFRIVDLVGDFVGEAHQRVRAGQAERAAPVAVGVEIEHGFLLEFL